MKKISLFLFLNIIIWCTAFGQVTLGAPFTDHMVLQRNSKVTIWGWANGGGNQIIEIETSWDGAQYTAKSNNYAKWEIQVTTPEAGGPYEITINKNLKIKDVLIGEVWLCSGQSNMDWSAKSGIDNADAFVNEAGNNQIRFFKVPKAASQYPQEHCKGEWMLSTPETMETFSAVSYFFGKELQENLNVPIGLIQSAWGGTPAEVWMPEEAISKDEEFSKWKSSFSPNSYWPQESGGLYNAMIHPFVPFDMAGVIWYQGETNTANPLLYRRLFPAMIDSWREAFKKQFSFYYVQIAPYEYNKPIIGALVREAQLMTLSLDKTGMVVVSDISEPDDIHPRNKHDVGKRLAALALKNDYGKGGLSYGPIYKSMEKKGQTIVLHFDHSDNLNFGGPPRNFFTIAGSDGLFYPANVKIEGQTIVLNHPNVPIPEAARYAFSNTAKGNFTNSTGLPASSFRTDDWPISLSPIVMNRLVTGDQATIILSTANKVDDIYYTLDGRDPDANAKTYKAPIPLERSLHIKARAKINGKFSEMISEKEITLNKASFATLSLSNTYNEKYASSGPNALIDGIKGGDKFNDGSWQGFQGVDVIATIDLGEIQAVKRIEARFYEDQNAWIFLPRKIEIEISSDGLTFHKVHSMAFNVMERKKQSIQKVWKYLVQEEARFVRIAASSAGLVPYWHPGSGGKSWIFVDEIVVD